MELKAKSDETPGATHEVIRLKNGDFSLRHMASGEVMHSNVGPKEEARLLYVEQSRLKERLLLDRPELVLFDVGLGAATNALAAIQCQNELVSSGEKVRPLKMISFENDLSGLNLAYANRKQLPYFEGMEHAVESLLESRHWSSELVDWTVYEGDFRDHVGGKASPELVFFDFYSPKTSSELWSVDVFRELKKVCDRTLLLTYSASTRVRVALLIAGFFVGYGRSTGAKRDTTVAATYLEDLERPLDQRWLERFERSHEQLPHGWPPERANELIQQVRAKFTFPKAL